jgi:hypothetical protein
MTELGKQLLCSTNLIYDQFVLHPVHVTDKQTGPILLISGSTLFQVTYFMLLQGTTAFDERLSSRGNGQICFLCQRSLCLIGTKDILGNEERKYKKN